MNGPQPLRCCPICGATELRRALRYDRPPRGETAFALPSGVSYEREYWRCEGCGHFAAAIPAALTSGLYTGAYVDATYGAAGIAAAFDRVVALPPGRSDNRLRVARVDAWWRAARHRGPGRLLDVGSGLAVFPAAMRSAGWDCTAVDPDPRAAEHARLAVGVPSVCADFARDGLPAGLGDFDLVSLNKVLEHVERPGALLTRARDLLRPGGAVYVEVPDGAAAIEEGRGREEFFIEHLHVFTAESLRLLASFAGLHVVRLERLREPSGKFTVAALVEPDSGRSLA